MTYPGAEVYRSESGEITGWDRHQADAPEPEGDFISAYDVEGWADQERDFAEEKYNAEYCDPCGVSPCEWDGAPDGFHTDEPQAE
jgi:hypothetical protein